MLTYDKINKTIKTTGYKAEEIVERKGYWFVRFGGNYKKQQIVTALESLRVNLSVSSMGVSMSKGHRFNVTRVK